MKKALRAMTRMVPVAQSAGEVSRADVDRLIRAFFSTRGVRVVRGIGYFFLIVYLVVSRDLSFSPAAAVAYVVLNMALAYAFEILNLERFFPKLNAFYFFPQAQMSKPITEEEWALRNGQFYEAKIKLKTILFTPAEDGLICVPVLLAGIGPGSAVVAGTVFAFLHIGIFTYLQSIGKGIFYGLVCLLILPYGILSVVVGHFASDLVFWGGLKLIVSILKRKVRAG